jgi:arabinan endo-1,5-alpha-L-arabinosidase
MNANRNAQSFITHKNIRFLIRSIPVKFCFLTIVILAMALPILALEGQIGIHDPSTVTQCDGKWYTWGTGGNPLVSDDGWTWRGGTRAPASGAAPDVIHVGDRYFMIISHGTMIWTKSLDPESPDYGWQDGSRNLFGYEYSGDFINPIDPGAFYDTNTGKLWLTYGSYFGFTRVVELDPKTGLRVDNKYTNVAINCEATDMIYHDGWYYLLGTHGSCCAGANSGYNIRVGRSKSPTGPFIDNTGLDMLEGGGKLVCGSGGRFIGAGHFGLINEGDKAEGVQKFSLHWESDLDRGTSVLGILPLLWKDGWPVAGELMKAGTYEIESARTGTALELAVEGVAVGGGRGGRGGGGMGGSRGGMIGGGRGGVPGAAAGGVPGAAMAAAADEGGAGAGRGGRGAGGGRGGMGGGRGGMGGGMMGGGRGGPIPDQNAAQVSANWPEGNVDIRLSNYMCQAQQKWTVTPAEGKGGYLGSPYFKITIAGTNRTLAATEDGELVALPDYTGSDEQLWRIEQFTDGTWRVKPKAIPNSKESLCLSAIGQSFASLAKYDPNSDKQRWLFKTP